MSHTSKGNKSRFDEPGGTFGLAGAARSGRENSMRKQGAISWKDAGAPAGIRIPNRQIIGWRHRVEADIFLPARLILFLWREMLRCCGELVVVVRLFIDNVWNPAYLLRHIFPNFNRLVRLVRSSD